MAEKETSIMLWSNFIKKTKTCAECKQIRYTCIHSPPIITVKHDTEIISSAMNQSCVYTLPDSGAIPCGTGDHDQPIQDRQLKSLQLSEPSKGNGPLDLLSFHTPMPYDTLVPGINNRHILH